MAGPSVSAEQNKLLTTIPSSFKIREAVFQLKRNNSPGPDGFSRVFFTNCWHIVGPDVMAEVIHFFTSSRLLKETNAYFLSLIPKKQSPVSLSDYKPISLLNFTYKIISKILASRLSRILPILISNHQSGIVAGRSIHHHVTLAHDLFKKLNSKIRGGSVCLKLDISKAFDKLQWNFLFRALQFFKFSSDWINLMRELVCTSRGSILINKSPCGFFASSCGLRQGDPLSPYLVILTEEILSLNVEVLRQAGATVPVSLVHSTPCHLLYADDIFLFLKVHKRGLRRLLDLLKLYQDSTGQCFNL